MTADALAPHAVDPLDTPRFGLDLYFADDVTPNVADAIPVFHRAIQTAALDGLLIDVADYKHVKEGPGVLLVAHELQYAIDLTPPGPSLSLHLRRDVPAEPEARLAWALAALRKAAAHLEAQPDLGWRFDRTRLRFRVDDRLVARPGDASYRAAAPRLGAWASALLGDVRLERDAASSRPLAVWLHLATPFS